MNEFNTDSVIGRVLNKRSSSRYVSRINYLKEERSISTQHIESGVEDVMDKIHGGATSFVIYGEPQAGKTETMIALTCRLLDEGFQTVFIVMNDNTELETQNYNRFHGASHLNTAPLRDYELQNMDDDFLRLESQRVIFCRKNSKNLQKLIDNCRFMKGKRVLIDDEADYATPDTNINKMKEATAINRLVGRLAQVDHGGTYIGVTATPGRLDLNNTYLNDSKDWVFLDPYPQYKGRKFFFPISEGDVADSDYILTRLPEAGDQPSHLRKAVYRFMLRVALLNLNPNIQHGKHFSMLIHTAGKVDDHREDEKLISKIRADLTIESEPTRSNKKAVEELLKEAAALELSPHDPMPDELVEFVLSKITHSEILIINHKQDASNVLRACKPKSTFVFAIGGNIVSRGLTFDNLLSFFFSRGVKGKLQQNTYIQRARMFGNRPYSRYLELCVPEALFEDWADTFAHHELSLDMARSGDYIHFQGSRTTASDTASIDKQNIVRAVGERAAGSIFQITDEFLRAYKVDHSDALAHLEMLKSNGLVPDSALPRSLISFIKKSSQGHQKPCKIVFYESSEDGLLDITSRSGYNEQSIYTLKGGIIDTVIHKRSEYSGYLHYVMGFKNSLGQARFYLRSKTGHRVLENVIRRR